VAVCFLDLDGGIYRLIYYQRTGRGELVDMVGDYNEYPDEIITPLSSADLDEAVTQFLNRPRRAEVLKIALPSGKVVVVMPEEHFEAYIATSELLSNPARAAAIKRGLDESRG
jgi:PHD/YefM family antitoxin component YafN of YafNO toxin-antitoxin module